MKKMKIADIQVGQRHRKDFGDIAALAASMESLGQIQPIAVTPASQLVDGQRRLEAAKLLGWRDIAAHVVHGLPDALALLQAERDGNVCRKDFAISEAVALGLRLEELERKAAKQRQSQAAGQPRGTKQVSGGNLPPETNGKTRDKVGQAVGLSGRTYEKAKEVLAAAEREPERFADLVEHMDKTGEVSGAHKQLLRREHIRERQDQAVRTEGGFGIVTGGFLEAGRSLTDNSIDLIFTDPPYTFETVHVYEALAKFAARVLRPGGLCLAYVGSFFLARVIKDMQLHLNYFWTFAIHHGQWGSPIMRSENIINRWKPIPAFRKGERDAWWSCFADMPPSAGREKSDHPWQQAVGEARHFIEHLCPPGGIVCDPFAGSGTICVAAAQLGRRYIAYEIDADTAARARARVAEEGHQGKAG